MKSILSPYDDHEFNEYLLKYIKKYLKKQCKVYTKDDEDRRYFLEENSRNYYTPDDIIESLCLNGRLIYFNNRELINYAVYDACQRFWYDSLKNVNNIIRKLFLEFQNKRESFAIQQRKLKHKKLQGLRIQGTKQ
jgi:hypothetical protein